jgi:hypothetical protein
VVGWRRSADRTCLRPNSLQTGNFSGNFAILALHEGLRARKIPVLQAFLLGFPAQVNREEISRNREFSPVNREHRPALFERREPELDEARVVGQGFD